MNFVKEKIKDFYLLDSKVENIFINEYMPAAPGDFVKVFIYAEMYAEHGLEMNNETIAKQLMLSEERVKEAWAYWEKMGAIKRLYRDPDGRVDFSVEFLNLKELFYGKSNTRVRGEQEKKEEPNIFGNEAVKTMMSDVEKILGRALSSNEITEIFSWLTDYNVAPEIVTFGVQYCVEKDKSSLKYIETVIRGWCEQGLETIDQVKEELEEMDQKYYRYQRVLKALGFNRRPTEAEREMMDNWFDNMGYTMEKVLDACGKTVGISSPNFKYVNKVLENWQEEAKGTGVDVNKATVVTQGVLAAYYDHLRKKAENEAAERRERIYEELPRIKVIDDEIRQLGAKLSKALLLGSAEGESKKIKKEMDKLSGERAFILTENNYEMDYTDIRYTCEKCNDTGITDLGERCSCIAKRTEEAEVWIKQKESQLVK